MKLFKKTSTGAVQEWSVDVEDNVIVTRWGLVGGAIQEARDPVLEGKNLGKKNATTPAQQAEIEAKALWGKKRKKGYTDAIESAEAGKVDAVIEGGIFPMLAHRFDQHESKLEYPCYSQPKLDGHRCIAIVKEGKCTLWSRTRKQITSMAHIVRAIEDQHLGNAVLDGELYNHDFRDRFEELTSFIRDSKFKPGAEQVEYHVYDMPDDDEGFGDRLDNLNDSIPEFGSVLKRVETDLADDEDELMVHFENYLAAGYEGAIARNANGLYVNKRSYDLLKIKEFADAEFLVTGVEEGRGKLVGHAIFVCKTDAGMEFRAKLKGPQAILKQYFDDPALAIGRKLTVKYQGLTNKNGVPRFPVALRFATVL